MAQKAMMTTCNRPLSRPSLHFFYSPYFVSMTFNEQRNHLKKGACDVSAPDVWIVKIPNMTRLILQWDTEVLPKRTQIIPDVEFLVTLRIIKVPNFPNMLIFIFYADKKNEFPWWLKIHPRQPCSWLTIGGHDSIWWQALSSERCIAQCSIALHWREGNQVGHNGKWIVTSSKATGQVGRQGPVFVSHHTLVHCNANTMVPIWFFFVLFKIIKRWWTIRAE